MHRFKANPVKDKKWARWNEKLSKHDITIDLANIRTISEKAYRTGFISKRVLKKWRKRGNQSLQRSSCMRNKKQCRWVPASTLKDTDTWSTKKTFWWACLKCGSVTEWVWEHELSEPMLNAYRDHTRKYVARLKPI